MSNSRHISIIYEDKDLIAVDKPSGLLSVATSSEKEETMYHMVSEYLKQKYHNRVRCFIVHRLDKDTSGVMVFAKSFQIKEELQDLFQRGLVRRYYEAVLSAVPDKPYDKLVIYLKEDRFSNIFLTDENDPDGQKAITLYNVVGINKGKANVKIEILTGKRNQIRMSFAEIGCPIVGDIKFGGKKNHRLLLNACELDLRKYLDKDEYLFKSKQSVFE